MFLNANIFFKGFLKIHGKDFARLQRLSDLCFIILSYYLIVYNSISSIDIANKSFYSISVICFIFINTSNLYKSLRKKSIKSIFFNLLNHWFLYITSLIILSYLTYSSKFFPRSNVIIWSFAILFILIFNHIILRIFLRYYRKQGRNSRQIIYWGNEYGYAKFKKEIFSNSWLGYSIVGWFGPYSLETFGKDNYLGNAKDMEKWLLKNSVDQIFFSNSDENSYDLKELLHILGDTSIPVNFAPNWSDQSMLFDIDFLGNQPVFNLWGSQKSYFDRTIKRIFDLVLSFMILLFLSPLLFTIYILLKYSETKDAFFIQERNGLDGKKFKIFKFRTMKVDYKKENTDLKQATYDDPRVTKVGKFLRKWSIDELPQLINVIRGDMSLVGPRPHAVVHNEYYRTKISGYMQRHFFKPGITGLAQVEGYRGETSSLVDMSKRVEADLRYMNNWSLFLDLKILFYTVLRLKSKKAY